jgi:hypothetical protein
VAICCNQAFRQPLSLNFTKSLLALIGLENFPAQVLFADNATAIFLGGDISQSVGLPLWVACVVCDRPLSPIAAWRGSASL